ncbi:MAG TPA: hypothetical protein VGW38_18680, partial [Chloroflexota bacterium]|nr:hypothetical protein [Chloroflexota bacterium]
GRRAAPATPAEAQERLARALSWPASPGALPIRPRYLAPQPAAAEAGLPGYTAQRFFFFTEPSVAVAGTMLRPAVEGAEARTWLMLLPNGTASDEADLQETLDLVHAGHRVCLFDPRGRGAVRSLPTHGSRGYDDWLGFEAYTNYVEMLLGGSTLASRVFDVARALEFLARHEATPGGLALRGHSSAALWGYFAAALDKRVRQTHLSQMLPSWTEVVETRLYDPAAITAAAVIPGVLQHFDLPDLRQCFDGRELRLDHPLRVAVSAEQLPLRP